jgi:RloB-like protein
LIAWKSSISILGYLEMTKINRKRLIERPYNHRDAKLFVIATEGEETEQQYFNMFHSTRIKIVSLPTGRDGKSAPTYVLSRLDEFKEIYDFGDEDEFWLVLDVDRWGARNLSTVCREATQKGYQLAISNPCFEIWLCLHFQTLDPYDKTCKDFKLRLKKILGGYNSSNLDLENYRIHVEEALKRATSLTNKKQEYWPSTLGTHVGQLVKAIMESINSSVAENNFNET